METSRETEKLASLMHEGLEDRSHESAREPELLKKKGTPLERLTSQLSSLSLTSVSHQWESLRANPKQKIQEGVAQLKELSETARKELRRETCKRKKEMEDLVTAGLTSAIRRVRDWSPPY